MEEPSGFGQAVQGVALVEERAVRSVQVFRRDIGVHGAAAEGHHPPAPIGDRKNDAVAEPVEGGAAIFGRHQQAGRGQVRGLGALGDQVVLERRAAGRRIADVEPRPLALGQSASGQIVSGRPTGRPAKLGFEPGRGQFQQ